MKSLITHWSGWPLERALFVMAGIIVVASSILVATVSPWFLLLTVFVGVNELLYAARGFCGASLLLAKAGLRPTSDRGVPQ